MRSLLSRHLYLHSRVATPLQPDPSIQCILPSRVQVFRCPWSPCCRDLLKNTDLTKKTCFVDWLSNTTNQGLDPELSNKLYIDYIILILIQEVKLNMKWKYNWRNSLIGNKSVIQLLYALRPFVDQAYIIWRQKELKHNTYKINNF